MILHVCNCLGIFFFTGLVPENENITIPLNYSFTDFNINYGTIDNTLYIQAKNSAGLSAENYIAPLKAIEYVLHGEPKPPESRFAIFAVFTSSVPCFIASSKFILDKINLVFYRYIPCSFRGYTRIPRSLQRPPGAKLVWRIFCH